MTSDSNAPTRRVVSSNGRSWETNAQGAADYLFNPVFLTFFFFCVVLYATLMQPSTETRLPILAQMILWAGLMMTSLVWLFASAWLSVVAHDRGYLKAIYTPLLLVPLVFVNALMGEFVLAVFNTAFEHDVSTKIQSIVKNIIILITFDIMHERFVVPQHPKYVSGRTTVLPASAPSDPIDQPVDGKITGAPPAVAPSPSAEVQPSESHLSDSIGPECQKKIKIARENIKASTILWVKSEDHYLNIQLKDRSIMLRGKLRTVVDELGNQLGVQINRSAWVAFSAIRTVDEQANGNFDVYLEDESVHRVASTRRLIFKQNYDRFKAETEASTTFNKRRSDHTEDWPNRFSES